MKINRLLLLSGLIAGIAVTNNLSAKESEGMEKESTAPENAAPGSEEESGDIAAEKEEVSADDSVTPSNKTAVTETAKKQGPVKKVSKIEYIGCKRVEPETISSYLPIQVGDAYDDDAINESLKALNSTGFFEDVNIDMKGTVLVVTVKEYPIISKISFEGNSKLSDSELNKIKLSAREVLSPSKIKEIQQGILEVYRKMGRYNASVNPKIIKLDNNRVNLVFEINEGDSAGISRIVFVGNDSYSASELRDVVSSKVKRWFRFFVTDDIYDPERFEEDKNAVTRFYHDHGFAMARVTSGVAELSSDKKEFILTFTIDEGDIYTFGDIKVKSGIAKLSAEGLSDDFYCKKGDKFNRSLQEIDVVELTKKAGRRGFSALKVTPEISMDKEKKIVNVTYNITEGEKVYISKIIIKGNTRTRDHIIRREIPLEEGDAYNQALASMAEANLRNTRYFKSVSVETVQDPNSPDKCILQVSVEETSTGEASINASYSTTDGLGFDVTFSEQNFFGTGKFLSVLLGSSRARTGRSYEILPDGSSRKIHRKDRFVLLNNVNVTVGDPHLFDKDMEGTVSFYRTQNARWEGFSTTELGAGVGLGYALTNKISQNWDYTLANRKFNDVGEEASPTIKYQTMRINSDGNPDKAVTAASTISSIKHTISYGTQFMTGLKGMFKASLGTTFAGIGGQAKHLRNDLLGSYLVPISRKTNVKVSLGGGILNKIGSKNPNIIDSYSFGLDSFRGFDDCGLGPRAETIRKITTTNFVTKEPQTNDVEFYHYAGAKKYWKGTVELTFPIGLPEELQFRGFVFSDFGTLWDAPEKGDKYIKYDESGKKWGDGTPYATCAGFDNITTNPANPVEGFRIRDSRKIRSSVGLGISLMTPFGPIKFTYAIPVSKEKYDQPYKFLLGFSATF